MVVISERQYRNATVIENSFSSGSPCNYPEIIPYHTEITKYRRNGAVEGNVASYQIERPAAVEEGIY